MNTPLLINNEEVFSVGNISQYAQLGDNSKNEIERRQNIIDEWKKAHDLTSKLEDKK